jgi:hypothetical protein
MDNKTAISTLYRERIEQLYSDAMTYVTEQLNGGKVDLRGVKLTFGGVSRYGRLLAYYDTAADTIVVPTGNKRLSIAKMTAEGVAETSGQLGAVLIHEFMHAADSTSGDDPHGTPGWCAQVARMAAVECGMAIDPLDLQRIMAFDREHHGAYTETQAVAGIVRTADPTSIGRLTAELVNKAMQRIRQYDGEATAACKHCGAVMIVRRNTKEYCSPKCRVAAHTAVDDDTKAKRRAEIDAKAAAKLDKKVADLKRQISELDAAEAAALEVYRLARKANAKKRKALVEALEAIRS